MQSTHEKPFIRPEEEGLFGLGMVFTIELPYYVAGFRGFNIEGALIVTEDGCESISTTDRSMYVIS